MIEPKEQFADISAKRLATVYAEALLNAAESAGRAPEVVEEIDSLVDDVLKVDRRLDSLFAGAAVGRKARAEVIDKAFQGRASDVFLNFMRVLNHHDRLDLIRPVRWAIHELNDERQHRVRVYVYAATDLSDEQKATITEAVHRRFNLEPILIIQKDPALLGGLKLRVGDLVYDATIRTRLDNLRNQLIERSSHEIQSGRDRFSSAE